jgi:hypothetical protein
VVFNGAQQSGAGAAGVTAATGTGLGIYNGWSTQEGYDITGGTLTIRPVDSGGDFPINEAYRSAMVYLAGVGRSANAQPGRGPSALADALSAAAAEAEDEGGK